MQDRLNPDASMGEKLLRLYQKLLLDGRRHFQNELTTFLDCSPQTVMRLVAEIEAVIGINLETGLENRRRWYKIRSISRNKLGLDFEELRYLSICRDLAEPYLPRQVRERVDQSIFNFSMLMADQAYAEREKCQKRQFGHCAKGWIDYSPFFGVLEKLIEAADLNVICLVRYRALGSNGSKEHRFALSRIVNMNNALYALGADVLEDFQQMKHCTNLAVHRIDEVILTDKPVLFTFPEEDLGTFGLPWHEKQWFRIQFKPGRAAAYVQERIWSEEQSFSKLDDGGLILEMSSRSEPEVLAWVRSFGEDAQLLPANDDEHENKP